MVSNTSKASNVYRLPDDWEEVKLEKVFPVLEAGVSVNSDEASHTSCYVLKTSSIHNGKFDPTQKKTVIAKDCGRVKCPVITGSIIISRMNTPQLVGECGYVDQIVNNCYLPDRLWQAQNYHPEEYDFRWLSYILSYGQYRNNIREAGTGTSNSMKNISKESLLSIIIPKPPIEEQRQIAQAISDVDDLILCLEENVIKLKNFKISNLSEMFPQDSKGISITRIQGCGKPWKMKKIGDCLSERVERSSEGELLSVTINDGVRRFFELGRYDKSSEDKTNYKVVNAGDIVYNTMRMWQGASGYSHYNGIVSPAYTVLTAKEKMCSEFFSYAFKQHEMINKFVIFSQGMTTDTWNLKYPLLADIEMWVPEEEEQEKIVEHFSTIDALIMINQAKLDKYRKIKSGMMDELLTGKVRLV